MLYVVGNRTDLLQFLPKQSVCAEVGVFTGAFSEQIDQITRPNELHLIDTWDFSLDWQTMFAPKEEAGRHNFESWFKTLVPAYQGGDPSPLYPQMYEDLKNKYAQDKRVRLHRGYSHEVGSQFPDKHFDFVYLDASHTYADVLRDLLVYSEKLKDGGIIMGDDFYDTLERPSDYKYVGTVQAVSQFLKRSSFKCCAITGPSESNFVLYKQNSPYLEHFFDQLYRSQLLFIEINDSQLANYCAKTFTSTTGYERRFVPSF
ncbi:MAG: class I SAM-dependent methyltransferase [Candidatus Melainabacteria bacterium]|nr:class I SAM-dependent methyltransferase [Candidatus Melainabacteria bacterium]